MASTDVLSLEKQEGTSHSIMHSAPVERLTVVVTIDASKWDWGCMLCFCHWGIFTIWVCCRDMFWCAARRHASWLGLRLPISDCENSYTSFILERTGLSMILTTPQRHVVQNRDSAEQETLVPPCVQSPAISSTRAIMAPVPENLGPVGLAPNDCL